MQALHQRGTPAPLRPYPSFLASSSKSVPRSPEPIVYSLPRFRRVMQILHHADLASIPGATRPTLASDTPAADPILAFQPGALVPALQLDAAQFAGGIFTASEQVGDCAAFCAALTVRLRQRSNVAWLLDTSIFGPVRCGDKLVA